MDSLVDRAIARRATQLADSALLSYHADAHGFLAFLAQLGEGAIIPPRVVQTEELALTIDWWQPGRSTQELVGRRDTTLLPAEVGYYRDRYAVILDNLPDRIRLGDGQDVRDVPHPLAAGAHALYEYRRGIPFRIAFGNRTVLVDEVMFRPRDPSRAAAIGSVYLDHETAAVVRLSLTFTRAAILDQRIETLTLTLENALIQQRYWLPHRQEVEVARSTTWLDLPVRGIVRGRWEISDYVLNEQVIPATKAMPRWRERSPDSLRAYPFSGRVVDMLPSDLQVATPEETRHALEQAQASVRAAALARPAHAAVAGRGFSDLARFSRTEGLAIGGGGSAHWGDGWALSARARYGIADRQGKGAMAIGRTEVTGALPLPQLFIERDYRDVAAPERAGVTNSLAALFFGSDYTTQVDTRATGVLMRRGPRDPWTLRVAYESDAPLRLVARPPRAAYEAVLPAWRLSGIRGELRGAGAWSPSEHSTLGRWSAIASVGALSGSATSMSASVPPVRVAPIVGRAMATLSVERRTTEDRSLFSQTEVGVAGGRTLPPQWLVFAGGPWSAPGYNFSHFATRGLLSQRIEFRQPVVAPVIPLGRLGTAPPRIVFAPFMQAIAVATGSRGVPSPPAGVYPSLGLGMLSFFDLIRFDVARGLRHGGWQFGVDIDRGFWGIL